MSRLWLRFRPKTVVVCDIDNAGRPRKISSQTHSPLHQKCSRKRREAEWESVICCAGEQRRRR